MEGKWRSLRGKGNGERERDQQTEGQGSKEGKAEGSNAFNSPALCHLALPEVDLGRELDRRRVVPKIELLRLPFAGGRSVCARSFWISAAGARGGAGGVSTVFRLKAASAIFRKTCISSSVT